MKKDIRRLLAMGLGVEDISVLLKIDPDHVRDQIDLLRLDGCLVELIRAG